MRIGLIGLSTPVAFDYGVEATRAPADLTSSPNPILDSPFGLMLLYDELWFLTRSLCPENMRNCSFVRFLDEEGLMPDAAEIDTAFGYTRFLMARAAEGVAHAPALPGPTSIEPPGTWEAKWENHSHGLRLGSEDLSANAGDVMLIVFDLEVLKTLGRHDVELIGNGIGQRRVEELRPAMREMDLAHVLTVDHIPNYIDRLGPYHPVIDEVRDDRMLRYFRRWISETAETSPQDARKMKEDVENRIKEAQRELFLEYLDPRSHYTSVAKTITGAIGDLVVPGVGTAAQLIQDVRTARGARNERWQGFLVSLKRAGEEARGLEQN